MALRGDAAVLTEIKSDIPKRALSHSGLFFILGDLWAKGEVDRSWSYWATAPRLVMMSMVVGIALRAVALGSRHS